jgi:hypothetical protein
MDSSTLHNLLYFVIIAGEKGEASSNEQLLEIVIRKKTFFF